MRLTLRAGGAGASGSGEQPSALERIQKETSRLRKKQKVHIPIQLVLVIFTAYWALGACMFSYWEKEWDYFDGVYFCFVTFSTIGFGGAHLLLVSGLLLFLELFCTLHLRQLLLDYTTDVHVVHVLVRADLVPGTEDGSTNKLAVVCLYLLGGLAMMSAH